ncbi:hypothetical protein EN814_16385 [Mesorhizobium sp. M2D.F.Ca.ET.171.01.1.1]|uniref:hypothetical protein n=1 Tax=unclassified Mesorhizobium TaxID=325217 RepID=UPI001091A2EA|nr:MULTISPECIES: hypothetical protein [unclassified Mesorhizobium]TGS95278.1 hypothetical protein EN821_16400 [Mesorhizobium sp. M2D.F.Ca.ET.178.01.1.1]TGT10817.1 hypothetical protein EN814_16385 [Mesorhizobium sp. M2D.F.Ca.ET.171.01.1.1]
MGKPRSWLKSWLPHRLELYLSPAWSESRVGPLRAMLERLEIEHLRHGGYNNGELYVSYTQFVDFGISRKSVRPTQQLAVDLGLLEVMHTQGDGVIKGSNAYRLTYVPAKGKDTPTDEWKTVSKEKAQRLVAEFRAKDRAAAKATRKSKQRDAA